MGHILERSVIHFFSSAGVYLIALWGFWMLERKVKWWPELKGWLELIAPVVATFLFLSFREIFDVNAGGSVVKSICDWLSWFVGLGVSAWALYRLTPRLSRILAEIREASDARE